MIATSLAAYATFAGSWIGIHHGRRLRRRQARQRAAEDRRWAAWEPAWQAMLRDVRAARVQ